MPKLFRNLTVQVLVAIGLGVLVGALFPAFGAGLKPLGDAFIGLIKMLIAPIIFLTVVLGMGNIGDLKKVGRLGGKALLYFELVTTLALVIGVAAANLIRPGVGVDTGRVAAGADATRQYTEKAAEMDWLAFFTHIIPDNFLGAFTSGEVLQVLLVAVLFGAALARVPASVSGPLLGTLERLSRVFFGVLSFVMKLAPLGAFGGMAFTIGKYGLAALRPLALLMGSVYLTMFVFIFGMLGGIARFYGFSLWRLLVFIREELALVLGTSSSESALPGLMDKLTTFGCAPAGGGAGGAHGLLLQPRRHHHLPLHVQHFPGPGLPRAAHPGPAVHYYRHSDAHQQRRGGRHGLGLHRAGLYAGGHQGHSRRRHGAVAGRRPVHVGGPRHHQHHRQRRGHRRHCQERKRVR